MLQQLPERLLRRFGARYILVMMLVTRICGSVGGLLVLYYVNLTLTLPDLIRWHFEVVALITVAVAVALTLAWSMWETRHLRRALACIHAAEPVAPLLANAAGREAVLFAGRHHRTEAWLVPCSTLVPVLIFLKLVDDASLTVMVNIGVAAFMCIAMALMSTYFLVVAFMRPVIAYLLDHGVAIEFDALPVSRLRNRFNICFSLIILTTALMIGTLAKQRATDMVDHPDTQLIAVANLRAHTTYITLTAVGIGLVFSTVLAKTVAVRVGNLVDSMKQVQAGNLSVRVTPTGNDEIDIVTRQFNAMVSQLDRNHHTIRDLNANLERKVKQRTRQLSKKQRELRASLKQLQEYDRLKTEFLANVSHELRTPLNGVIGMSELLLDTNLDAHQRRYTETARVSAKVLLQLISDVLDFSKIEAGRLELEAIDFDVHEIVEQAVTLIIDQARRKNLEVVCFVDPDLPMSLHGDPGRLQQIMSNLLANAVKFTAAGCVSVKVLLDSQTNDEVLVRCAISDTGIGIPSDRLPLLFQSFSQVDSSTTRKYGGTGLGLSISKRLTELMGGQIGVDSEQGRGSTFWFTVLLVRGTNALKCTGSVVAPWADLRVLVVDDNRFVLESLGRQLEAWGVQCQTSSSGAEALACLRAAAAAGRPFHLTLLDLSLPKLPARDLAGAIKSDPNLRDSTLLLMTGLGDEQCEQDLAEMGVAGCLCKPITASRLFDTIVRTLPPDLVTATARPSALTPGSQEPPRVRSALVPKDARILLVEDNEVNQLVATEMLAAAGYSCDVRADGKQGLEALTTNRYDLVLMDCQMPEMDGYEATRALRELERQSGRQGQVPVIALTANALTIDRQRCLDSGMTDYLKKPLSRVELLAALDRYLPANSAGLPAAGAAGAEGKGFGESTAADVRTVDDCDLPVPMNYDALVERFMGNWDFLQTLCNKFMHQLDLDLEQLERSVAAGDAGQTARSAHRLKGAAASLCAEPLVAVAAQLESLGRQARMGQADQCLARLCGESNRLRRYLDNVLLAGRREHGPGDNPCGGVERRDGDGVILK